MYNFVNKEKYRQICTCLVWFYFTLLVYAHFCNEIERSQLQKSLRYFVTNEKGCHIWICPLENVWFCFVSIVCVIFSHKIEKFLFCKSLKYFIIFWPENIRRQIWVCPWKGRVLFHFPCLTSLWSQKLEISILKVIKVL